MSSHNTMLNGSIVTEPTRKIASIQSDSTTIQQKSTQNGLTPQKPTPKRKNTLLSILILLVAGAIIFATLRYSAIASGSNDKLLVRIGSQQEITVDLRQGTPRSPYLTGVNIFPKKDSSSYDEPFSGFMHYTPLVTTALRDMKTKLLRYPGGDWGEEHVLSYEQLADFSRILEQTKADGMLQAHISGPVESANGTLQPEHLGNDLVSRAEMAGHWVDYMNNKKSTFRQGKHAQDIYYPVKLWTVGNEPDRLTNPLTGKRYTVAEYTEVFIEFSKKMHQNDPTIKVFGPELSQFYGLGAGPKDEQKKLWMEEFLRGVAAYEKAHPELQFRLLDGISLHRYPFNDASTTASLLLSSSTEWNYLLPSLKQFSKQLFGRDIPIGITEINTNPTNEVPSSGNAALWWADTLGTLQSLQAEYVAFFSASGVEKPYPLFSNDGLQETPMSRVMQLFARQQKNVLPLGEQRQTVSMFATLDDSRQTVSLLFINKSSITQSAQIRPAETLFSINPWSSQEVTLAPHSMILLTIQKGGGATAYSFTVPSIDDKTVAPLTYTVCGKKTDALAHNVPC